VIKSLIKVWLLDYKYQWKR